jgi:hypothetical protein
MKKVFAAKDPAVMVIVRDLLSRDGIETKVLNEHTASVLGEIPFLLGQPELWVLRDEDVPAARDIVARYASGAILDELSHESWTCATCGEVNEGQFTQCWKCEENDPREDHGT